MHYVRFVVKEPEDNLCFMLLPDIVKSRSRDLRIEAIQCSHGGNGGGYSLIRITDPRGILADDIEGTVSSSSEGGSCSINRISSTQFIAIVINKNCGVSKIFAESDCFLTSSVMDDDGRMHLTLMAPDKEHIRALMKNMTDRGFSIDNKTVSGMEMSTLLSDRQEEAVRYAVESGFYDIPRSVNMEELSRKMGCTKSTLNITLRNAEKKIMNHYVLYNKDSIKKSK